MTRSRHKAAPTTGGPWSAHQVIRALANRVYLGELSFRDNTVTDTHPPLIAPEMWTQAQPVLAARGESAAHRAASGSDHHLTGLLRCPQCGKATRHPRHRPHPHLPLLHLLRPRPLRHRPLQRLTPQRTHRHPRQPADRTRPRHPHRGRRPPRRHHQHRQPEPAQSPRRGPHRAGHHHRTRPARPRLPDPPTRT
ncbi:MAG: recombinase family protein [Pseudonocardia sp.]|nr:recombinase family protein [Pseudonocardia sp.]